ncbi:MAG: tRNA (adenosine(37)-N6)-threonylcarbamoyltransferase complex ATPase subunit type 1 TsaE [Deltaproteobacteria bacterium]|nr:tRNA (adenosine(37)-N6)-threonylcarbamoyltransferase complex ATPase subunit type 1 TsaE [Deltaproteobacteria bacterium]
MDGGELDISTDSSEETEVLGEIIGSHLVCGDVVALIGDLGTGKTCLTRGIARGLRIDGSTTVVSPTFTIINEHQGPIPLYHFDLYRVDSPSQMDDLGYEEYFFGDGVSVIEWAEKAREVLPENYLEVSLFFADREDARRIGIAGRGERIAAKMALIKAAVRNRCN